MIAPLVTPMTSWEKNCAGSRTACTSSKTSRNAVTTSAMRVCQLEALALSKRLPERPFVTSPVAIQNPFLGERGPGIGAPVPVLRVLYRQPFLHQLLDIQDAVDCELAVLDRLHGEFGERRVAILVEAPGAEYALVVFGSEDLLQDRLARDLAVLGGPLDGVEHHVGRLVGVGGIRLDLVIVLGLIRLDELLTLSGELALGQAAEGDVDALRGVARLHEELVYKDAVRADKGDLVVGHPGTYLVLYKLSGVVLDNAAEVDRLGVLLVDLVHQRAVVGGGAVDALAPQNLYAGALGNLLELVGEALAVGLLVVEHVDGLYPPLFEQGRARRALLVVGHDHAGVVALARRVVLLGLIGLSALFGQTDVGVGRADHADDIFVLGGVLRVLSALGLIPLPGLRRGVVEGLVFDLDIPSLAVALLYRQLYGIDHRRALGPVRPLKRQVADYLRGRGTVPAPSATACPAAS